MRYRTIGQSKEAKIVIMGAIFIALVSGLTSSQATNAQVTRTAQPHRPIYSKSYPPIDNIYCDHLEGMVMHLHAHVSLYINGQSVAIPQYVGIARNASNGRVTCYYWLHVHDRSGIIHIEPPIHHIFTLGQFLDEWQQRFQPLGFPHQLLSMNGWSIWTNGQPYRGTLRSIPLTEHSLITLAYNSPHAKPDTLYAWPY